MLQSIMIKPFIKYPGGKKKISEELRKNHFPKNFNSYFEPFIGGGAIFFLVAYNGKEEFKCNNFYINDINTNISSAYKNIRDNCTQIIDNLSIYSEQYSNYSEDKRNKYYYLQRRRFNRLIGLRTKIKRRWNDKKEIYEKRYYVKKTENLVNRKIDYGPKNTSLLIFLNKTCFNGVYRENSYGGFNVPHGKFRNTPNIVNSGDLTEVSIALKDAQITNTDFSKAISRSKEGDFIYLDPPYMPISKTSHFTMYDKSGFNKTSQERLKNEIIKLNDKGCKFLLSNSDNGFIRELYKDELRKGKFFLNTIKVPRMVNSKGERRGEIDEIIIKNYK